MKNIYKLSCLFLLSAMSMQAQEDSTFIEKGERELKLGYGVTVKAEESSAAVSEIRGEELMKSGATGPLSSLIGKGLGLTVLQNGGDIWGDNASANIRGYGNMLVVVDGFERNLSSITKEEIESVQILKDAAATALYGLRGAGGVLVVTTKTGTRKKLDIRVNYEHHFKMLNSVPEMADGYTYAQAMNEALANDGLAARYDQSQLTAIKSGDPHYGNVNWMDEVLKTSGSTDNIFVTASGGGKYVRYFSSVDYLSSKGFMNPVNVVDDYSSQHKYSKLNVRSNIDVDLTPSTQMFFKLNGMLSEHNRPGVGSSDLMNLVYTTPSATFPVKTPYGDWGGSNTWTRNPVAEVAARGYARSLTRLLFADVELKQDLGMLVKGLSVSARIAYDNFAEYWDTYGMTYAYSVPTVMHPAAEGDYVLRGQEKTQDFNSSLGGQWSRFNFYGNVDYDHSWGKHQLATALTVSREVTSLSGQHNTYHRINLVGHAHYVYDGKYIADLAVSHNGSNLLAPGNRFGTFPALSAAWVLSKENFMKEVDFIDLLKVRASWGLSGSDMTPGALLWNKKYGWASGYILGGEYGGFSGLGEGRLPTEDMTYEKVSKMNLGIDISFAKMFDVTLEVFKEKWTDLFVEADRTSSVLGQSVAYTNTGKVDMKGVELGATFHKQIQDFTIQMGGNFTFNRSKVVENGEGYKRYDWMKRTGQSVGQLFGYEAVGFFKDEADIAGSPTQTLGEVKPGDIKFRDLNGDNIINEYDQKAIGYSTSTPEIYYSLTLGLEYKGFGIDALIQGVGNYSAIASQAGLFCPLTGNASITQHYYDNRWTPENQNAKFPRLSQGTNANNYNSNTVWLTNRSYLKLRHAELYYKFTEKLLASTPLKSAKLYVRAADFRLFDHVDVCDPEAMSNTLPIPSSVQLGFSIGF